MKKTIISCVLFLTAVTAFSQTPMKTAAEAKLSASDLAVKIADRILATTTSSLPFYRPIPLKRYGLLHWYNANYCIYMQP